MALGQASLTVGEQANTFATLAAGGMDTTQHVIARITAPGGPVPLKVVRNTVLEPGQAADVDYALSFDTQPGGTAYPNATMADGRPVIGKTGTTNTAQSAFFIGSIPQYTLAVGIFTQNQSDRTAQTLNGLGGLSQGGFGGTWPAHDLALVRREGIRPAAGPAVRGAAVHRQQVGAGGAAQA